MLQLEHLVADYPPTNIPGIQTIISAKKEFIEVGALAKESPPIPGETFYNNQESFLRQMLFIDKLLIDWQTGTGKTCALGHIGEYYHDIWLRDPVNAPIKKTIVLTPGPGLRDDIRLQLACQCTKGQYLTTKVMEAKNEQVRKNNLKRSIGKWYTVETYKRFILPLQFLSDEELKRRYSRTIIFIDEIQNLNISKSGEKETRKKIVYQQLWRLLHVVEGCKIILATATTMINETKEIAPLMNLILDADMQLPDDWDYNTVTAEQLEPYFRGKVSFVRALDTGINVVLEGERLSLRINTPKGDIETDLVVETSIMGDVQLEGYNRAKEMKSGVYDNERQASNFVFPDGSWGGNFPRGVKKQEEKDIMTQEALGKYVISSSRDNYHATKKLKPWLKIVDKPKRNEKHLDRLSCKYANIIRKIKDGTRGTVFVYNDFVFGSGAIVHGLCFEANGFERYKGDKPAFKDIEEKALSHPCASRKGTRKILLDKRLRYALITSETKPESITSIKNLFNSPENIHGEYIKALIGSQVTREGLNLSHGTQIHMTTTWWNRSAVYQAISRAIRATSHVLLLEEERKALEELWNEYEALSDKKKAKVEKPLHPDEATIPVQIFKHAALPEEGDYEGSVDIFMYEITGKKDYDIRRMERIIKTIAIDCWLHYERNIRKTDIDYSADCDYAPCEYECFDPIPTELNLETYDVYYIDETLVKVSNEIAKLFTTNFSLYRQEIYTLLDKYREVEIDRALTKVISEKRVINDRYGFLSYLREDGDRFFLHRDFPTTTTRESAQNLGVYTGDLIASREISLPVYLTHLEQDVQSSVVNNILTVRETAAKLEKKIEALTAEARISLFEKAVYSYVMEKATPTLRQIIDYFGDVLFILYEPIEDIEEVESRLAQRKGPGRPRKKAKQTKTIKLTPEDLIGEIVVVSLDEARELVTGKKQVDIIFLHTLYNTTFDRLAYSVTTKFKKGEHLRIFKPAEGKDVGWRDTKISEIPVYSAIIQELIGHQVEPFEKFTIYGTVIQDGKFRIRDKTTETTRKQKGTGKDDARFPNRGRICKTIKKRHMIDILWKIEADAPAKGKRKIPEDREDLIEYLVSKEILQVGEDVDEWDDERLRYYALWDGYGPRQKICNWIYKFFEDTGRLFTI